MPVKVFASSSSSIAGDCSTDKFILYRFGNTLMLPKVSLRLVHIIIIAAALKQTLRMPAPPRKLILPIFKAIFLNGKQAQQRASNFANIMSTGK